LLSPLAPGGATAVAAPRIVTSVPYRSTAAAAVRPQRVVRGRDYCGKGVVSMMTKLKHDKNQVFPGMEI
jgi:hypothetical protein